MYLMRAVRGVKGSRRRGEVREILEAAEPRFSASHHDAGSCGCDRDLKRDLMVSRYFVNFDDIGRYYTARAGEVM